MYFKSNFVGHFLEKEKGNALFKGKRAEIEYLCMGKDECV